MANIINPLPSFNEFETIRNDSIELVERLGLEQVSIQVKEGSYMWDESSGKLANRQEEELFSSIHPDLKDTVFERYIDHLNRLGFDVIRTRIMVMKPFSSYEFHKDPTPRIHLPLVTSERSAFLFPDQGLMFQLIADGSLYWADTRKRHSFVNWADTNRLHLVSVVK